MQQMQWHLLTEPSASMALSSLQCIPQKVVLLGNGGILIFIVLFWL
jgi:hypothetical protein